MPPPRLFRFVCTTACAALLLLAGAASAQTKRVEVPLVIPPAFLERLLVEQVFTDPATTARIVASGDPCSEIVLSKPALRPLGPRIFVTAHGRAQAGFTLLGSCYRPFDWEGEVEAEENPSVARGVPVVEFRVSNSWLSDESDWLAIPALWDWVKPAVHPRLEALRVDLAPLVDELRRALPLFAARREEPAVRRLVDSLELADVRVDDRGLVLRVRFEVEAAAPPSTAAAAAAEPPLAPEEVAAFEATLHEWDAFLTFVIKSAGSEALDPALRAALLAVLLDSRHEIVAALAEPTRDGEDRVRKLFLSSWRQLQPPLRSLSGGNKGLRYLAFVAAGDALAALDEAGPSFGFEISSDGLRRLARTLAPETGEDPLLWSEEVDPALRETFGFEAELPALPPPQAEPALEPEEAVEPSAEPTPDPVAEPSPEPTPAPGAALLRLRALAALVTGWLWPAAFAAPDPLPAPGPQSSPLDGYVPRLADLDHYLPEVAALLHEASRGVAAGGKLEREHRELFQHLTLATAWQESCWRQYVSRKGKRVPLRSNVGALGLMQVNPHVWRGFYSVDGLSWSIGYNARAGGEILLHYLRDYALARGEDQLGGADALARASYAAYHGGPRHLRRYREPKRWRSALVAVDRAFHAKFQQVAAGRELGVRECFPG
jgi:soluble lytic murein transglycosylase-like protein